MLLKRLYRRKPIEDGGDLLLNEAGEPMLEAIELRHTGVSKEQNFSTRLVITGIENGWMHLAGDELVFKVRPEPLKYRVSRHPGRYCDHCGEKLSDDDRGELARLHVLTFHLGKPPPNAANPSGYMRINHFECVLDPEQHRRYHALPIGEARRRAAKMAKGG